MKTKFHKTLLLLFLFGLVVLQTNVANSQISSSIQLDSDIKEYVVKDNQNSSQESNPQIEKSINADSYQKNIEIRLGKKERQIIKAELSIYNLLDKKAYDRLLKNPLSKIWSSLLPETEKGMPKDTSAMKQPILK